MIQKSSKNAANAALKKKYGKVNYRFAAFISDDNFIFN
tara:strand:- start:583 stop:696 length:114 start_codon:yes stop_codon:yes gene_type:complete